MSKSVNSNYIDSNNAICTTSNSSTFVCGSTTIDSFGNLTLNNPNTGLYSYNISQVLNQNDITNITTIKRGLNLITKLNPVSYNLLTDNTDITYIFGYEIIKL